ncbi:MAG: hypothetical protein OXD31_17070 [Chloroflexi bacterium]|nr:hypothetical protein [Chloroflexota bacterium]
MTTEPTSRVVGIGCANTAGYAIYTGADLSGRNEDCRMYSQHPSLITPPPETVSWRYLDFTKFVLLLERNALFFAKASQLGDPFEGSFEPSTVYEIACKGLVNPNDLHKALGESRDQHLVNCRHESDYESAAMWNLYGQVIVIRTTSERLCQSFECENDIYVGRVTYVDHDTANIIMRSLFNLYRHKRLSFQFEQEVRAITVEREVHTANWVGQYYNVDVEWLIERVVVAPNAPDYLYELAPDVVSRYYVHVQVQKSALGG